MMTGLRPYSSGGLFSVQHHYLNYPIIQHLKRLLSAAALLMLAAPTLAWSQVMVLGVRGSSEPGPAEQAFAAFQRALPLRDRTAIQLLPDQSPEDIQKARLIIAFGRKAFVDATSSAGSTPVIGALIGRNLLESIKQQAPSTRRRISAIVLEQPVSRQVGLLQALTSNQRNILLLAGPSSEKEALLYSRLASQRGFKPTILSEPTQDALFKALATRLPEVDVLVAMPDPVVLNPNSARKVLLNAYRHQIPLLAFSPIYVKAGALASVSSSPDQIGQELALTVHGFLSTGLLPNEVIEPREFSVDINESVARSLELSIPEASEIERQLRAREP